MNYKDVVQHYDGAVKAARALGVTRQSVYRWQDGIPVKTQAYIELMTAGQLRADLPDARRMPAGVSSANG